MNRKLLLKTAGVLLIFFLLFFAFYTLLLKNLFNTTDFLQDSSDKPSSPFGEFVDTRNTDTKESPGTAELKKDLSAPIITDYMKIIGMSSANAQEEPGPGNIRSNSQVNNITNSYAVGYITAWVMRWEAPNKLRLVFQNTEQDTRGDYEVNCADNTLYISKKDNSVVATNFDFMSQLEEKATVFIKCTNAECTELGGACIIVK